MYDAVLVPTDGSEGTSETLDHAFELARAHGATVHALSVVDERNARSLPEDRRKEALETMERHAEEAVSEVADRGAEAGVEVTTAVRQGIPAERIVEYAHEPAVDLVTIGTRGRSDRERYGQIGSVAQRVVENATVPVFVVHIGGETA